VPNFIHRNALGVPGFFQRLHGHVQANLVTVLESVCNGFGHTRDLDGHPFKVMNFDALSECNPTESRDVQWRVAHDRCSGLGYQKDFSTQLPKG
jgi:hypothetical protein